MLHIASSRRCITPVGPYFPCYLCGHAMRTEKAIGIKDDLFVSAHRLLIDKTTLIFVSIELIGQTKASTDLLKDEISHQYAIDPDHINISFVHTHSAPEYAMESPFGHGPKAVTGYPEYIHDVIKATVDDCFNTPLVDVSARTRSIEVQGYYGSRNGLDLASDKTMRIVEFIHDDHPVASWLNITCHPTVLGPQNLYVSADLAGYLCRGIQKKTGVYPLFMQGAAGDVSNRLYRQGNDYDELIRVGEGILSQWFDQHDDMPLTMDHLVKTTYDFNQTFYPNMDHKRQRVNDIQRKIDTAQTFDEKKVYTSALAAAKANVNVSEYTLDLHCVIWKMDDVCILSIPAELFNQFGVAIKKAMAVPCPIIWGYSNYSVGYLVDQEEYGRSFESACSDIPKGTTELIVDGIIDTIAHL